MNESLQRTLFSLPVLRSLRFRRWVWNGRNDLLALRRRTYERFGSDRYSRPALHAMDAKLAALMPRRGGFFVEAGAYDGFIQSNTYWFARFRGWRGVLVEPIPHLYERARRQRPEAKVFNCALVPEGHPETTVRLSYGGLMSTVRGAKGGGEDEQAHVRAGDMHGLDDVAYDVLAPARTLTSVLDEAGAPQDLDLLSLDVEGFEASVLQGLDLDRYRPRFMLIEMHDVATDKPPIDEVLAGHYQVSGRVSPTDLLYERTQSGE
jgi:FkbM family methyltransferase